MKDTELTQKIIEFLQQPNQEAKIRMHKPYVLVEFRDILMFDHSLAEMLLDDAQRMLKAAEGALAYIDCNKEFRVRGIRTDDAKVPIKKIRLTHLGRFVSIIGNIVSASPVRPRITHIDYECPGCGQQQLHFPQTDINIKNLKGHKGCGYDGYWTKSNLQYVDEQKLVLEEIPDHREGNEMPERINILLRKDLCAHDINKVLFPGEKIRITGVIKDIDLPGSKRKTTERDIIVDANWIEQTDKEYSELRITQKDEEKIRELSTRSDLFELFIESYAPHIFGYDEIKGAIILQLFGGVSKLDEDGNLVKRPTIHLLLIGDPAVAKSVDGEAKCLYSWRDTKGYKMIKDIIKSYKHDIQNLKIQCLDMKTGKISWGKVKGFLKHKSKKLVKINTKFGREIIGTTDHSFLRYENNNISKVKGNELVVGDKIPIGKFGDIKTIKQILLPTKSSKSPSNIKDSGMKIKLDYSFGFLMGMIIAEGTSGKKMLEISVENKILKTELIKHIKRMGLSHSVYEKKIILNTIFNNFLKDKIYSTNEIKHKNKGWKSSIKKIPEFCFFAPNEFKYGLLAGEICGDGTVDHKTTIRMTTVSKQLGKELATLANTCGFATRNKQRYYTYKGIEKKYYNVYIYGDYNKLNLPIKNPPKKYKQEFCDKIPFLTKLYESLKTQGFNKREKESSDKRNLMACIRGHIKRDKDFVGRTTFSKLVERSEKMGAKLNKVKSELENHNLFWDEIISITPVNKEIEVYDFEVDNKHTFVANDICVHNSQMARFALRIAPKARYFSGSGATGAGIAGTTRHDEFIKGWVAQPGAVVLANKGIVVGDELDKVRPDDLTRLHEAMEHCTVTIEMAGKSVMRAETSLLAAANPKGSRFSQFDNLAGQINFPSTLISRFDLVFAMVDTNKNDRPVAKRVIDTHRKYKTVAAGALSPIEMKKYLAYAKRINPKLTVAVAKKLEDSYCDIRTKYHIDDDGKASTPVTARNLDAFIRIAEASARMRLSKKVEDIDVDRAINLVKFCLQSLNPPEVGVLDADSIELGTNAIVKKRRKMIKDLLYEACHEAEGGVIDVEEFITLCDEHGFNRMRTEEMLEKFKKIGDIMEPRRGKIKWLE